MTTAIVEGTSNTTEAASQGRAAATVESNQSMTLRTLTAHAATTPAALTNGLRRIVLTGFMGAGKTTIGRLLAERLGWEFLDLDTLVEDRTGLSIAELILRDGETTFRHLEAHALAIALGRKDVVLALGGGATETLTNRLLLEQTPATLNIFLDAPFAVLLDRCMQQENAAIRPFLADLDQAQARFQQRLPHYRRIARLTLDTTELDPETTVNTLMNTLA